MAENEATTSIPGPAEDKGEETEQKGSEDQQVSTHGEGTPKEEVPSELKGSTDTDPATADAEGKGEESTGGMTDGGESAEGRTDAEGKQDDATESPTTEEDKPATETEDDKPAAEAEGDKPAAEAEGDKPAAETEEDKPVAEAETEDDKPAEAEEDKPATETEGEEDKPAAETEEDKPATETEGEGDKPVAETEGEEDKPAAEAEEDKPATETEGEGDKPVAETEGEEDKPAAETEEDKPVAETEEEEDKPATEAEGEGDQPATEVGDVKEAPLDVESDTPPVMATDEQAAPGSLLPLQPTPLEDIVEEEEIDREAIIQEIKEALAEQDRLHTTNGQIQHKIAEYLARKKTEERPDPGRNVTDQEKRYVQCVGALDSLERELIVMHEGFKIQEQELKIVRDRKLAQVDMATADFATYKRENAVTAVHSRTGRRLTQQEVDQYQAVEDRKELDVIQVRLENVKLQNKIQKLESLVKQKEQLAEGLHMIDFEQLKINNVDLNEKIEDRNEDIMKLRKKVTATVQVLTHVKEKLQFLQAENNEKKGKLQEVEGLVAKKRDHLTRMKQARDALRMDNIRLRQKGGLVSHSALLRDFEERRDQSEALREKLEDLQRRHSELTVLCDGLRRRIEQARTMHPQL